MLNAAHWLVKNFTIKIEIQSPKSVNKNDLMNNGEYDPSEKPTKAGFQTQLKTGARESKILGSILKTILRIKKMKLGKNL